MVSLSQNKSSEKESLLDQPGSPGACTTNGISEAKEYVDSSMSSQRVSKVDTPFEGSRKRHLSTSGTVDTTPKKARNGHSDIENEYYSSSDQTENAQPSRKTRRKLYRKDAPKVVVTEADVHVSAQPSVEQLIAKLSTDMNMTFLSLNEKFEKMESGLDNVFQTR